MHQETVEGVEDSVTRIDRIKPRRGMVLWLLPALAAMGCGSDESPTEPVDLGDFPTGTYGVTLDESEVSVPTIAGAWQTEWTEQGELEVRFEGDVFVSGVFDVDGGELAIQDLAGGGACPGLGVYEWSFDGAELSLAEASDACSGRIEVLTLKPWVRES